MSKAKAPWLAAPGDDLPRPGNLSYHVTLLTCIDCGTRAANPAVGTWHCPCGGETVAHEFSPTQYSELRKFGEVRTDA